MRSPEGYVQYLLNEVKGGNSWAFLILLFANSHHEIVRSDDADLVDLLSGMMEMGGTPVILGAITDEKGIWGLRYRILPEYTDNEFVQALSKAMMETAKQMSRHNLDDALKHIARASRLSDET